MKRWSKLSIWILIIVCVTVVSSIFYVFRSESPKEVMSFEACTKAGYQCFMQPSPSTGPIEGNNYVPGEILVQFKQVTSEDIAVLFKKYNLKYKLTIPPYSRTPALALVEVPKGEELKWITIFKKEPIVLTA